MINIIDPKKVPELSEQEKWVCTVKWLNSLYSGHYALLNGEFTNLEEYIEYAEEADPCSNECPYYEKCPSTAREPYRPFVPIPINFRVLERFTGEGSVAGPRFLAMGNRRKGNAGQK